MEVKNIIQHSSFSITFSLLVCLFSMFLLSSCGYIFHLTINVFYFPLSIIISQFVLYYLLKKKYKLTTKTFIINSLIFFLIILLSYAIALITYDYSYDGRSYHQAGIMLLSQGWNPVYDNFIEFVQKNYPTKLYHLLWIENYTKFAETIQSNIFVFFKEIEAAKMTHYISAAMLFLYSFYVFGKESFSKINLFWRIVLSLILVINPIFVAQALTYYIDLYTYIFFMLILFAIIDMETSEEETLPLLIIIMSAVCLLNIKFWGYIYFCTAIFVYSCYLLTQKQFTKIKKIFISSFIILILVSITGLNPYLTNLKQGRNIIYPVLGSDEGKWVMDINIPKSFSGKNYLHLFLLSTFSQVDNFRLMDQRTHQLKVPFTINSNEFQFLRSSDTRICGFGIYWSGILLLALLLAIFINYKKQKIYTLIFLILLFNLLFQPFPWWARYIPQLWAFPVFVVLYFLSEENIISTKGIIALFITTFMFFNVTIQTYQVCKQEKAYKKFMNYVLSSLIQYNKTVQIYTIYDWSIIEKLRENGIKTEFVSDKYFEENGEQFELVVPQLEGNMYWKFKE